MIELPWWGFALVLFACVSLGACVGLVVFALLHAASQREDN